MHLLQALGVETLPIDMTDPDNFRKALDRKTDLVYFEVHSNPELEVIDAKTCIGLGHQAGAKVVIDNTWLTPYLLRPLSLGADIVLHSATKYMMGHGNGLAGIVCGSKKDMQAVVDTRTFLGTSSPRRTLPCFIRVSRRCPARRTPLRQCHAGRRIP